MRLGQIIKARATSEGEVELFKISKIGRKYLYLKSDTYSSDGLWQMEIKDFNLLKTPLLARC